MFLDHDLDRDDDQLFGRQAKLGYDWWWHSFTAHDVKTGKERPFYVEYYLCNPDSTQDQPVFGQLPKNKEKGIHPSYLMVNAGTWGEGAAQLHRFYGWGQISVKTTTPYEIKADGCYASETHLKGSVAILPHEAKEHPEWMSDAGSMSWDLQVRKEIPFNVGYGAGKLFRELQLFQMFWHAEGMKSLYSGTVRFNGRDYIVRPEDCYGYADKNWGQDFTTPWLWISSCHLTSEITGKPLPNSVFDIGGGRPKIGPISLPGKLLCGFLYEGQAFEFNFSKPWTGTKTWFDAWEDEEKVFWHVDQSNWTSRMVTDLSCQKKDMLLIRYEAPDGSFRHTRLWNGGNGVGTIRLYKHGKLLDRIRVENAGCEYGEYDARGPYQKHEQQKNR